MSIFRTFLRIFAFPSNKYAMVVNTRLQTYNIISYLANVSSLNTVFITFSRKELKKNLPWVSSNLIRYCSYETNSCYPVVTHWLSCCYSGHTVATQSLTRLPYPYPVATLLLLWLLTVFLF